MQLSIYSYNGTTINDGSTYAAWFPSGQPSMPTASPQFAPVNQYFPKLGNKGIDGGTLSFHILCLGTMHTQYDTLKALFRVDDFTFRQFIVKDTADTDRQWYVYGYAIEPLAPAGDDTFGEFVVTLALDLPLWRTVTESTSSWSISSTGSTKVLTVLGNQPAKPTLSMAIGSTKTAGYARKWWKPWYNPLTVENNESLDMTNGGWNTSTLIADTSVSNQINKVGGITAVDTTIPIDTAVGGGLATSGGMCYVDSEQIYYTAISGGNMTVYSDGAGTTGRGWGGTTAAIHADNAVLKKSHMQANGADIRVTKNGVEVDRWLDGINTSSTKIWCTPSFKPLVWLQLRTAIASSGTPTYVNVKKTNFNRNMLKKLPARFLFVIDSEVFLGKNAQPNQYRFALESRAQKSTSMAAHAVNATIRILEWDLNLIWGNPLAEAPTVDDNLKPVFALTSTNTSWVHAEFWEADNLRRGAWKPAILARRGRESGYYTDTQEAAVDPSAVMGIKAKPFTSASVLKSDTVQIVWSIYHPAGFTTITMSGNKYRSKGQWLAKFALEKSLDGVTWSNVFTEATPASAVTWTALSSHSAVSLSGNYPYLRIIGEGSINAVSGNQNDFEITDDTLAINSSNVPQLAVTTSAEDNYYLDAEITVNETGDSMTLRGPCKVGSTVVLDTEAQTVTVDGNEGTLDVEWNSSRTSWLDIPSPKQSATCTLQYDDTGTAGVTITVTWENRAIL